MSEGLAEGPQGRPHRVRRERLRLLAAVDPGDGGTDVLRSALAHAMAEFDGLGGMAHLATGGVAGELDLVVSSGLPASVMRAWQIIPKGDPAAPAEAWRTGRPVWRAAIEPPAAWAEESLRPRPPRLPLAAGMLCVPLPGPAGPLGALSVLVPSDVEPARDQQQFLQDVARSAAEVLLRAASDATTAAHPADAEHVGEAEPQPEGTTGMWELDIVTGRVVYSDSLSDLVAGIGFDGPRERFESWRDVIHPDDLPNVGKDLERSMRSDRAYETEFRVRRANGSFGWLRIRARITVDESSGVIRLVGTFWDTTWDTDEDHAALDSVARVLSAVRAASARAALIDRLTRALTEAVTPQNVVDAVAENVLPAFNASGLLICEVQGGVMRVTGAAGYSQDFIDRLSGSPFPWDSPFGQALRTRAPMFFASAKEVLARFPHVAEYPFAEDKDARAFLPLIASGRVIGVGVLGFAGPCHLSREERTLLTALSGLIAQALDRARLYDDAATRARELQRDLLPRELPELPCLSAAAHYRPAGYGAEIGGDWYDVIPLSSERVALVIGDVMGHGISEAATMGRLRTAVRTLSDLDLPPDEILDRLNAIVGDLGEDYFATCLYGVYDPVTGVLSFASAGHPPPVLVRRDGTAAFLTAVGNPPLGAAAPPFDTMTARLRDGDLLVLYTDGLVEAIDRDIESGMARLADTLTGALRAEPDMPLRTVRDNVTRALLPAHEPIADDAALLVLRTHRIAPENVVSWTFADDPRAAGLAREHVRGQLAAWGLDDTLLMTTELLVSELVGNVIRHAKGPIGLRMIRSWTLTCEVSDSSLTTPLIRRSKLTDEGGRGLQLVAALSHRWGTRYNSGGKTIWVEQRIPQPGSPRAADRPVEHQRV
ncbi:SpoIIE family protein phosphatase [Actinomadura sp. NBRC 104425]|uniref:SpoIIE family protein phosphatase n=1 Tax=Actinomadura sp. NBRC 104425 TaxID=3032204 RepID=UPI0025534ECC|nr:SpoIIE family protein phosphatase [Actinomadura sp. NBRC 104425]